VLAVSTGAGASSRQAQTAKPTPTAKPAPAPKPIQAGKPVPDPPVRDLTAAEEDAWAVAAEETTTTVCGQCHPIPEITRTRRTWRQWNDSVVTMGALGAPATEAQLTTVKLYMTRYYGAVNVNTASIAELSAVLGLSSKESAAIVEYRKANGRFANAEALAKVEGIDKSKLEEQAQAIRFE
jgi:competence protein ComEA